MRAVSTFLLCVVFLVAGFVAGGAFAVKGKTNNLYLQVDNDAATVLPMVSKGDTVTWVNVNAPDAGHTHNVITFKGDSPCAPATATNPCKIAIAAGRRHYTTCPACPDPTIPVGNGDGSAAIWSGGGGGTDLFTRAAQSFYSALSGIEPASQPSPQTGPPPPIVPSVEIPVECGKDGTINVPNSGWTYTGTNQLIPGIHIKWSYSSPEVNTFTVAATGTSPTLSDACNFYPSAGYPEGMFGVTKACVLNTQSAGKTYSYNISTTSTSCKAANQPFTLQVPDATNTSGVTVGRSVTGAPSL